MSSAAGPRRRAPRASSRRMVLGEARETPLQLAARQAIRTWCRARAARDLDLHVEGQAHVPVEGPALLASRHYHHLYDACALLAAVDRPLSFFVALDWVQGNASRGLMEWACRAARWPIVLRAERLTTETARGGAAAPPASAYSLAELRAYMRAGLQESMALLLEKRLLAVFPEGYPNVDPTYTPKHGDEFLPFRAGFARIVERAATAGCHVPTIPAGLSYERGRRWQVAVRFGPPLWRDEWPSRERFVAAVETSVRRLSATPNEPGGSPQVERTE